MSARKPWLAWSPALDKVRPPTPDSLPPITDGLPVSGGSSALFCASSVSVLRRRSLPAADVQRTRRLGSMPQGMDASPPRLNADPVTPGVRKQMP